jgi:8-oxo-dGTP diphosphatase
MSVLDVTCAIIIVENKTLVVQRSETMSLPLKWEFPGGKIELNETESECILREIKEELDIEIEIIRRLTPSIHQYSKLTVNLIPFICIYALGEIKLNEHKQYLLLDKAELMNLDWAEADIPIVKEYLNL